MFHCVCNAMPGMVLDNFGDMNETVYFMSTLKLHDLNRICIFLKAKPSY